MVTSLLAVPLAEARIISTNARSIKAIRDPTKQSSRTTPSAGSGAAIRLATLADMKPLKDMKLLAGQTEDITMTELRSQPGDVMDQVQMGKTFNVTKAGEVIATISTPEPTALELGAAIRRLGLYGGRRGEPNISADPHARPGVGTEQPITKYPDEPHPDDEHAWKAWWVKKCYDLQKPLTQGDLVFINQCWKETKARWNLK